MEICPKCGLPKQACVCEQIIKGNQKIRVTTDQKRYGKIVTVVTGFDSGIDIKKIAKSLKNKLSCGGTYRDNMIKLQGDHRKRIKGVLAELGFDAASVED